jgi:hypothetical protein
VLLNYEHVPDQRCVKLGLLPPPLWGRVGEGGGPIARIERVITPTPNPSPQGGGEHIEFAALFVRQTEPNVR